MATKKPATKPISRLTAELLETADGMHASGVLTDIAHENIIMRHRRAIAQGDILTKQR